MKTNLKKFFLASFVLGMGIVGVSAPASASSSFSMTYTETNGGYHRHYHPHKWDSHKWERKAYKRYKREMRKAHRRAIRHARRYHSRPVYVPTFVYHNVTVVPEPTPIVYAPTPLLANQASPSYVNSSGQTCREYQSEVMIGGRMRSSYGTACLQSDGAWRIVE